MSNIKNKAVSPAAVKELEIMPVKDTQVSDYEQTSVKPPRIQQIEQYIQKRKEELDVLDGRIMIIEKQRPGLAFKNDTDSLSRLEKGLAEVKEMQLTAQAQIEGAEAEIKREVEKWIKHAQAKRTEKVSEMKREANALKEETIKHFNALEKLTGQKATFGGAMMQQSIKEIRLREQIGFYENDIGRVREEINRLMSN